MYYSPSSGGGSSASGSGSVGVGSSAGGGSGGGSGGSGAIVFPRTVCRSASSVLGMIHWQWRTIEVASGVMNAWPPKEEKKREVLTFRGAKVTSITPLSDPKAYAKLMKNAADAAAKRPSTVAPISQPAFVRLELPPSAEKDKDKDKAKTREVFIVVPDEELQAWLRVFTGAQDAQRYSLAPDAPDSPMAATVPSTSSQAAFASNSSSGSNGNGNGTPSSSSAHLKTAPGALQGSAGARGSAGTSASSASSAANAGTGAGRGAGGLGASGGTAQRPMSVGLGTQPQTQTQTQTQGQRQGGTSGTQMRPMSLAIASGPLNASALPPDPNVMLGTVISGQEPASVWAMGTQQPGLTLDDPDDGPVIIAGADSPGLGMGMGLGLGMEQALDGQPISEESPWREYLADDGVPYYHNEITNETTWERPEDMDTATLPLPAMPSLPPMPQMHNLNSRGGGGGGGRGGAYPGGFGYGMPPQGARGGYGGVAAMRGGSGGGRGGGATMGGGMALPAYPQPTFESQSEAALSSTDAADVLAALDEFEDMHFGVGTLPAHVHHGGLPNAQGNPGSPFGSHTLAELDELNNPEFF